MSAWMKTSHIIKQALPKAVYFCMPVAFTTCVMGAGLSICLTNDRRRSVQETFLKTAITFAVLFADTSGTEFTCY